MPRNWIEDREKWEQDRGLYELELQSAFTAAANRRLAWLAGVLIAHIATALLVPAPLAMAGFTLVGVSAVLMLRLHFLEIRDARADLSQKLELKFPDTLTPGPPPDEGD